MAATMHLFQMSSYFFFTEKSVSFTKVLSQVCNSDLGAVSEEAFQTNFFEVLLANFKE